MMLWLNSTAGATASTGSQRRKPIADATRASEMLEVKQVHGSTDRGPSMRHIARLRSRRPGSNLSNTPIAQHCHDVTSEVRESRPEKPFSGIPHPGCSPVNPSARARPPGGRSRERQTSNVTLTSQPPTPSATRRPWAVAAFTSASIRCRCGRSLSPTSRASSRGFPSR